MLRHGPEVEFSEELCEGGGLVVGVQTAGVREHPRVAAAERGELQADSGFFVARDNAVGTDADEGHDGRAPEFDLRLETLATGAKFTVSQFISARCGAFDDVRDAQLQVKQQGFFKGREEARREAATMQSRPEAVAWAAEVMANGGGIETGIDADEEDNEIFGGDIRDDFVMRGQDLGFGGLPRSG